MLLETTVFLNFERKATEFKNVFVDMDCPLVPLLCTIDVPVHRTCTSRRSTLFTSTGRPPYLQEYFANKIMHTMKNFPSQGSGIISLMITSIVIMLVLNVSISTRRRDSLVTTSSSFRDAKMVMTESPPCWRKCPHRKNIIYFKDGPAGLSDRKFIIRDLAELAGYLCAHLVLPPPTELLDPIHNFNEQVSIENDWSDYFNITFAEDGEPVIRNDVFIDEARKKIDRSDWLHVISSDRKMRDDFEMIHRFTWEQSTNSSKGFVWEIHKIYRSDLWENDRLPDLAPPEVKKKYEEYRQEALPYYHKRIDFQKRLTIKQQIRRKEEGEPYGCMYTNKDATPQHTKVLQKRLAKRIMRHSLKNSIHILLHLRRGDVIDLCDNSVGKIREYLSCSFSGMEDRGMNFTVFMTTDEVDNQYRRSIIDLENDYPYVKILDADTIVKKVVNNAIQNGIIDKSLDDNYYVFEVESMLHDFGFVNYHLIRRRKQCHKCIPISTMIE